MKAVSIRIGWHHLIIIVVAVIVLGAGAGYVGANVQGWITGSTHDTPVFQGRTDIEVGFEDREEQRRQAEIDRRLQCLEYKASRLEGVLYSHSPIGCY